VDGRTMRVLKAKRIDIEWVCRAYLYGSAWRAYRDGARVISGVELPDGLTMAEELPEVILTPTTKSETGHDRELSRAEAIDAGIATRDEWRGAGGGDPQALRVLPLRGGKAGDHHPRLQAGVRQAGGSADPDRRAADPRLGPVLG